MPRIGTKNSNGNIGLEWIGIGIGIGLGDKGQMFHTTREFVLLWNIPPFLMDYRLYLQTNTIFYK